MCLVTVQHFLQADLFSHLLSMVKRDLILQCRMKITPLALPVPFWKCQVFQHQHFRDASLRLGCHTQAGADKSRIPFVHPFAILFRAQRGLWCWEFTCKSYFSKNRPLSHKLCNRVTLIHCFSDFILKIPSLVLAFLVLDPLSVDFCSRSLRDVVLQGAGLRDLKDFSGNNLGAFAKYNVVLVLQQNIPLPVTVTTGSSVFRMD